MASPSPLLWLMWSVIDYRKAAEYAVLEIWPSSTVLPMYPVPTPKKG